MADKHLAFSRTKPLALTWTFGDGIQVLSGNPFGVLYVPFAGFIESVVVGSDASPTLFDVDILTCLYDDYPGSLASIVGASFPTLNGAQKYEDALLSDWTKDFIAGSFFKFSVLDTDTLKAVTVALNIFRY